jgi:hypothetical protein
MTFVPAACEAGANENPRTKAARTEIERRIYYPVFDYFLDVNESGTDKS